MEEEGLMGVVVLVGQLIVMWSPQGMMGAVVSPSHLGPCGFVGSKPLILK